MFINYIFTDVYMEEGERGAGGGGGGGDMFINYVFTDVFINYIFTYFYMEEGGVQGERGRRYVYKLRFYRCLYYIQGGGREVSTEYYCCNNKVFHKVLGGCVAV